MDRSIQAIVEECEEKSYTKLVKQLQQKGLRYFETPLMVQDKKNTEAHHFLSFMQVTMSMMRERNKDMYRHMIN